MAPAGWNTADQIRSHKLAASIISGHGTENDDVLDDNELDTLQRFCKDPCIANRDKILEEQSIKDDSGGTGDKAISRGSLAGYLVAKHGTEEPALDDRDIAMLKAWFEKGKPTGENVVR